MKKKLSDKQKEQRLRNSNRQRQKISRKMIFVLGSSVACLVVALIVVINLSHVDDIQAAKKGATNSDVIIIPDEVYATSVKVGAPAAARTAQVPANAQLGHVAKPLPADR